MRAAAILLLAATPLLAQAPKDPEGWAQHDRNRPEAAVVDPGTGVPPETPGKAPSDAVVLFDGKDLSAWRAMKGGGPAMWKVADGHFEVVPKTGGIETVQPFGDAQLHVEWMSPDPPKGTDQDRGNSGVFFGRDRYEVQVLDSYQSRTYTDGQAGALYGQYPPLVNATRKPGQWQAYDIVYEAPRFDEAGNVQKPARLTVFLNGVLVQHAMELVGPTTNKVRGVYSAHPVKQPISLQDHSHPVRFRNIWLRELQPRQTKP
jgi:hypothetical protein